MSYLLDASVCIDLMRRDSSPMHAWLERVDFSEVYLCSIVKGELLLGIQKSLVSHPE